jgi:hypothetical protein
LLKRFRKPLKTYSGRKTNAENVILHYVEQMVSRSIGKCSGGEI